MPVMLTLSMTPLPSIVSVYMIAQNIISTVQQLLVKFLHDQKLMKKLVVVLKSKYAYNTLEAETMAAKLLKLSQSINFLADELGEFDHIKTLSVKVHDIPFERVLKKVKDPAKALVLFDKMAKSPEKAEEILTAA